MLMKVLCLMLLVAPAVFGNQAYSTECPNVETNPAPRAVRVQNCEDNAPFCNVRRHQPAAIQVLFQANIASPNVRVNVEARLPGSSVAIPFPIGQNANLCSRIVNANRPTVAARCPLVRGQNYFWTLGLNIPSQAPAGTRVSVTLRSVDVRTQRVLFCTVIRVRVVN